MFSWPLHSLTHSGYTCYHTHHAQATQVIYWGCNHKRTRDENEGMEGLRIISTHEETWRSKRGW